MAKHGKDKATGVKLPKHIAGVKIPKEWRKGGEALLVQAQSPEGRAAIAKGVTMVAGAAAAFTQAAAAKKAVTKPEAVAGEPGKAAANPDAVADAIGAAADAVLGRLFPRK